MQLSPTYRAVLTACPDIGFIYRFIPQLGRGRCSWIHALTKTGQKISRFLKKGLIKIHVWLNDSEVISTKRDRIYQVSQQSCSCPEWKYRVSKNKSYKKGVGKVDKCKHQMMQLFHQTCDISHFANFIETQKVQATTQSSQQTYQVDCVNVPDGISIEYQDYWQDFQTFDVYYKNKRIGEIESTPEGFETSTTKGFKHTFTAQDNAIDYLLKQNKISPTETDKLLEEQELQAMRDLFGDDMYPETQPFDKLKTTPVKPQKKWIGFSDINDFDEF